MATDNYWEERIAANTWRTYNTIEDKNRDLLAMYNKTGDKLAQALYQASKDLEPGAQLSSADTWLLGHKSKLYANVQKMIKQLGTDAKAAILTEMQGGMERVYTDVQEALGIDFNLPDPKVFEHLLTAQWHGSNFSSRIWANTRGLAKAAGIVLTDGLTQGRTIAEMAISLDKIVHDGFTQAHRLVRTETMHVLNSASLRSYQDAGITQVEFCAAIDERTCEVCGALHGKVYPIAKAIHIPVHPNCRCCWLPVVDAKQAAELKSSKAEPPRWSTTKKDVTNRLKTDGGVKTVGLKGLDLDASNAVANAMDAIYTDYPQLRGFIQAIKTDDTLPSVARASCQYTKGKVTTSLLLNPKELSSLADIEDMINLNVKEGFWTDKDGLEGILRHECGHLLEYNQAFRSKGIAPFSIAVNESIARHQCAKLATSHKISGDVVTRAFQSTEIELTSENIKTELGGYAEWAYNEYGTLGEAFAEAVSAKSPGEVASEIIKMIRKEFV